MAQTSVFKARFRCGSGCFQCFVLVLYDVVVVYLAASCTYITYIIGYKLSKVHYNLSNMDYKSGKYL